MSKGSCVQTPSDQEDAGAAEEEYDGDDVSGTKLVPVKWPYIRLQPPPGLYEMKAVASIYGPYAGGGFNYHYHLNINSHNVLHCKLYA